MIRAGETLVNPVSGETITFIETAAETNGEYTLIEVSVAPGGGVPMAHIHPYQTETFEVLEGELSMKAGREKRRRTRGRDRQRPAARGAQVLECDRLGRPLPVHRRPGARLRALHRDDVRAGRRRQAEQARPAEPGAPGDDRERALRRLAAPYIPAWMQKAGLLAGAALGRTLGYDPTYERQTPVPELVPAIA